MPLINLNRKVDTVKGYELTSPEDMVAALKFLANGNYTGHLNCAIAAGAPVWTMGLQSPGQTASQSAAVGDWIVIKNNSIAEVVTAAQFTGLYNIT